jgi:hypothetical protein
MSTTTTDALKHHCMGIAASGLNQSAVRRLDVVAAAAFTTTTADAQLPIQGLSCTWVPHVDAGYSPASPNGLQQQAKGVVAQREQSRLIVDIDCSGVTAIASLATDDAIDRGFTLSEPALDC